MSSIKVVDVNSEEGKQEEAIEQPIEEVKEEVNEVVEEAPQDTNEVVEEVKEETTKVKTQDATQEPRKPCDKMVRCPKCNKEMKLKNFRYGHQQRCQGGIENKPVKPHTKARAKPIIKQVEVNEQPQEEHQPEPKPVIKQQVPQQQSQPSNPLTDITNHYQLLQNQYIQQKKEKHNNLCQSMFAPKSKKR